VAETNVPLAEEITLEDELKLILWPDGLDGCAHPYLTVRLIPSGGYEVVFGQMYDAPEFGLRHMKALAELFGVADADLDVDNYSQGGCDTCDYYSKYGHEVQLRNVTKREAELKALVGRELLEPRSP